MFAPVSPSHFTQQYDSIIQHPYWKLGYHVTLVRDATAAYTHEAMHATMNIDGPTYAHEILTTVELVSAIKKG